MVDLKQAVETAKGEPRTIKMESTQPIANASTNFLSGKPAADTPQGKPAQ